MKILMVALFSVKSCGPTEVIKKVVPEMISLGNIVDIFSPYSYDEEKEMLANKLGMNYFWCRSNTINTKTVIESVPDIKMYDIIHMHGVFEPKNWMLSKVFQNIDLDYVFTIHGNLMNDALKKSKVKKHIAIQLFIKNMLKGAKCLHALSENEASDIRKIVENKISIIPNGIDCIHSIDKIDDDNINLLFIGRIDIAHKGIDLLLEALLKMSDKDLNNIKINIVGPFETEKDKVYIEKTILNKKIENTIKICGPAYGIDKCNYLKKCDYFIHTSRYEGMPMAVLEALSYGIPCIVTENTNVGDIILKAKAGVITKCDPQSINKVLSGLKKNIYHVDKKWLAENLLWKFIAKKYLNMYI